MGSLSTNCPCPYTNLAAPYAARHPATSKTSPLEPRGNGEFERLIFNIIRILFASKELGILRATRKGEEIYEMVLFWHSRQLPWNILVNFMVL